MIKLIVSTVAMCVLYFVLQYLNTRDTVSGDPAQNDGAYVVRLPAALKNVYGFWFGLGVVMLAAFGCFWLKGVSTPDGMLWFATT